MSIATLFREIFLRLNTLAEQLRNGLAGLRNTAVQTPEPGSEIPETADSDDVPPADPQEFPADRQDRPLSTAELAAVADRIAERLSVRHDGTASGAADMPFRQSPSSGLSPETVREIVGLTAEHLAARRTDGEPDRATEDREAALNELSAKLDTILAAVRNNGEQIRKLAEIDTNTIFFS